MANRYWVGGSGTWSAGTANWSAASALSFTASCTGTALTTTGSPALVAGTSVWAANNTSLGTIVSGSGNAWVVSVGGTFASQTMKAATIGASAPTSADSVFFDANSSGTAAYTVTPNAAACLDLNVTALTPTFSGVGATGVNGNISLVAGTVWSNTGALTLGATTAVTITTNGTVISAAVNFTGIGGSWQMQDALSVSTATLTNGTLNLNGKTLTAVSFSSSNTNARTIAFGTGNITTTGSSTTWNTGTTTSLTITGTPVVNIANTATSGTTTVAPGPLNEANSISFNFLAGTYTLAFLTTVAYTARDVNFTGFGGTWSAITTSTVYGSLTLSAGMTIASSTSSLTLGATSGTKTITSNGKAMDFSVIFGVTTGATYQLQDAMTLGSTRTATLTAGTLDLNGNTLTAGLFSSANSNTRAIAFGIGNITVNGTGTVWNTSTFTGLTTSGTQVVNVSNNTATATTLALGALAIANAISFNITAGTYILTISGAYTVKDFNFTGFSGSVANLPSGTIYGNLTLSTGLTLTAGTSGMTFGATSGTKTITTNGKTLDFPLIFSGTGGAWQLQDALTMGSTRTLTQTNGTLDLNGKTLTTGTYTTAAGTKNLTFNAGTLVISGSGTSLNNAVPTGFTTTAGTGVGVISMTSATAKSIQGGGSTYNCTLNQGGAGALTINGTNTWSNITNTVQPATVTFQSSITHTFLNFNLSGTAGNLITINANVGGARATISKASGTVSCGYLSIQDSAATGGAAWYAGANSTNVSNNTGWIFTAPPGGYAGNFFSFLTN